MSLENIINEAWKNKDQVNQNSDKNLKDTINQIIDDLDSGIWKLFQDHIPAGAIKVIF